MKLDRATIGFVASGPLLPVNHHHLPMLCDPETEAGVELHTEAVHRRSERIVPVTWFFDKTRVFAFRGSRVRVPDATRSVAHSVIHDQLDHEGYKRERVDLRQLLDLAIIRARHESAIDWVELDHRFVHAGVGHVLATYLQAAEVLLGQRAPVLSHASSPNAIARLRRAIDPGPANWRHITKIVLDYVAARSRDPVGVLNLLRLGTWQKRTRRITELITEPRAPKW
jgi:hypothetical protein